MKQIKVFIHDGRLYQEPHYIWNTNVAAYIAEWKELLYPEAVKANNDHFVYAVKTYNDNDELQEIDIYSQPLNDKDFQERTDILAKTKNVIIMAWHKGTAY